MLSEVTEYLNTKTITVLCFSPALRSGASSDRELQSNQLLCGRWRGAAHHRNQHLHSVQGYVRGEGAW